MYFPKGKPKLPVGLRKGFYSDTFDLFPNDLQDRVIEILLIHSEVELKTAVFPK